MYKDSMSYVITTVRRKGDRPRTLTIDQPDDRTAKHYCSILASQYSRVTLHGMDEDGILTVVARYAAGHRKRGNAAQADLPPVRRVRATEVIDGEVGEVTTVGEALENLRDAAEDYVEATDYLDVDENPIQVEDEDADSGETYEGYCVKCREKREFHGHVETGDTGRRMAKGTCPVCGTKMNRILANLPHEDQESYDTPDDEPETQVKVITVPDYDEDGHSDGEREVVVQVPAGTPAEDVAEAAAQVAEDATEAVQEADEAPKRTRRPPRPRKSDMPVNKDGKTPPKKQNGSKASAAAKAEFSDAVTEDLPVAECFKCNQKIPVQERHGMRIMMTHSAPGIDRCPGSLTVVG